MGSEPPSTNPDISRFPQGVVLSLLEIIEQILGEKWFMSEFLVSSHTLEILEPERLVPTTKVTRTQRHADLYLRWEGKGTNFCGVLSCL